MHVGHVSIGIINAKPVGQMIFQCMMVGEWCFVRGTDWTLKLIVYVMISELFGKCFCWLIHLFFPKKIIHGQ